MTGQIADAHPGQNKEPAVIDDPLQAHFAGLLVPANPAIAGLHAPGPTGILQATEQRLSGMLDMNEIAQMRTERDPVAQVMITVYQLPPQCPFFGGLD